MTWEGSHNTVYPLFKTSSHTVLLSSDSAHAAQWLRSRHRRLLRKGYLAGVLNRSEKRKVLQQSRFISSTCLFEITIPSLLSAAASATKPISTGGLIYMSCTPVLLCPRNTFLKTHYACVSLYNFYFQCTNTGARKHPFAAFLCSLIWSKGTIRVTLFD